MAISEQKLRELAAIEPPKFLERIADFLADLTMRTSAVAVLERAQTDETIGQVGRRAMSLGETIASRAAGARGNRSVAWLYDLLKPYQIGPYELRQFSMWLVRWHDKLAETEVLRERPASTPVAAAAASVTARAEATPQTEAGMRLAGSARPALAAAGTAAMAAGPGAMAAPVSRRVVRATAAGETVEYVEGPPEAVRRVRVLRRAGMPEPASEDQARPGEVAPARTREPGVLDRAWRVGRSERAPAGEGPLRPAVGPEAELAPPGARKALTKALWMSNLAMAGAAAGYMMGRSAGAGAIAARVAAPALLGVAGPSTTSFLQPPGLSFPLSHPPVSTASWLGAAPPAPEGASFVPMPGGPLESPMLPTMPAEAAMPQGAQMPIVTPVSTQPPMRPAVTALEAHRGAMAEALSLGAVERPVAIVMSDGSVRSVPSYPSSASPRRPSPIPGLLAAGLAGFVLGRVTSPSAGGRPASERWFAEHVPGTVSPQRVRVYSHDRPETLTAILVPPGARYGEGGGLTGGIAPWVGVSLPVVGSGAPMSRDVLGAVGTRGRLSPIGSPASGRPSVGIDPRLGEVTVVAPPVMVASEQAERRGAAVAFDWPVLARRAGQLDAAGLARLREILPPGAQAIYPALPKDALPTNAVNLRLAPSLLKPLLSQAYGSDAAGIAGSAAATASAVTSAIPANAPVLGRIVPARRPEGQTPGILGADTPTVAGALAEAGGGQARRTQMLDFLGMPVRLAPSLGGRAELRDELAARGVSDQVAPSATVRPHVFGPLRQQLFPGLQTVHAEPDKSAWRKAAPQFGMRDSEPTTVLAPDARIKPLGAHSPRPQMGSVLPAGIGSFGAIGPVGPVGPVGQVGRVGHVGHVGQVGRVGHVGNVGQVGSVGLGGATGYGGAAPADWPVDQAGGMALDAPDAPVGSVRIRSHRATPRGFGGPLMQAEGFPSIGRAMDAAAEMPMTSSAEAMLRRPIGISAAGHRASRWAPEAGLVAQARYGTEAMGDHLRPEPGLSLPTAPTFGPTRIEPALGPQSPSMMFPRAGIGALRPVATEEHAGRGSWSPAAQTGSGLGSGLMGLGRMGVLGRYSGAYETPARATSIAVAAPVPVGVPDVLLIPTPVIAGVADKEDRLIGARAGRQAPAPVRDSGIGGLRPLTVPFITGPPVLGAIPVGIGMPVPVPVPDRSAGAPMVLPTFGDMALPVPAHGLEMPVPQRTSTSVVSRAPERYYAAADAGPASRRVTIQRASSATGGVTGGPHVPPPSPHRAERMPADTQRASVLASREDGMTANEVHLLANDVWSLLRRRLALEADRRGKW